MKIWWVWALLLQQEKMADWVHCNRCYRQPGNNRKFHLTNCGHIYCEDCVIPGKESFSRSYKPCTCWPKCDYYAKILTVKTGNWWSCVMLSTFECVCVWLCFQWVYITWDIYEWVCEWVSVYMYMHVHMFVWVYILIYCIILYLVHFSCYLLLCLHVTNLTIVEVSN